MLLLETFQVGQWSVRGWCLKFGWILPWLMPSLCCLAGSNSVNLFLGLGVSWTIVILCHGGKNIKPLLTGETNNLVFSVMTCCIVSVLCFVILGLRRKVRYQHFPGREIFHVFTAHFCVFEALERIPFILHSCRPQDRNAHLGTWLWRSWPLAHFLTHTAGHSNSGVIFVWCRFVVAPFVVDMYI